MTLDLASLRPGDTIRSNARAGGDTAIVSAVGTRGLLATHPDDGAEFWINSSMLDLWSVVVPPPPCPITEPTTIYKADLAPGEPGWVTGDYGRFNTRRPPITLHPPGTNPTAETFHADRWGYYTWGDPS